MASLHELPPDQLAVLRLLAGQGGTYAGIAGSLHIAEREVRSRAVAALDSLASCAPPPQAERDATADYLLGQQDEAAARQTRAMLAASPAALEWARSLEAPLGEISTALARLPEPASGAPRLSEDDDGLPPAAAAATAGERSYGRILLVGAAGLAILAAGLVIGRITAPDSRNTPAGTGATTAAQRDAKATPVAAARLKPPPGAPAPKALGIGQFARQQGQNILGVAAQDMPRAPKGSGYGVWLTGGAGRPAWLGYFSAVNQKGQIGAQTVVPVDPTAYKTILITLETTNKPTVPGKTYLSGAITATGG